MILSTITVTLKEFFGAPIFSSRKVRASFQNEASSGKSILGK
jgi:hypothetical protein